MSKSSKSSSLKTLSIKNPQQKNFDNIFTLIKNNDIRFVDFRFSDYRGKWLHITHASDVVGVEELRDGISFDGSSVPFWKHINESDMILLPDLDTAFIDPFTSIPTLVLICDVIEPSTGKGYERDPRHTAKLAEAYLQSTGVGDVAYFGPEPEFFVFDDVRFQNKPNDCFYAINSEEDPSNNGKIYPSGNMAHRSSIKGAYFDLAPLDSGSDIRSEMMETLRQINVSPILHHHEVANSQF